MRRNWNLIRSDFAKSYEERQQILERYSYQQQKQYIKIAISSSLHYMKNILLQEVIKKRWEESRLKDLCSRREF